MRHLALLLAAGLVGQAQAQTNLIPNPGFEAGTLANWSFQVNSPATSADASGDVVSTQAHSGSNAAEVVVNKAYDPTYNWYIQLQLPKWNVAPTSRYKITFWAKGPATTIHVGFLDIPADYTYIGGFNATLTSEWKQYTGELVTTTQTGKSVSVGFYVAGSVGSYYFDDATVTLMDPLDTAWYGRHPARIDSLRRKNFTLTVQDSLGKAVPDASVRLKLQRHAYPFGTALAFQNTSNPTGNELWYRQTAAGLFNHAVFENDFKWPSFEAAQGKPDTARIAKYLKWGDSLGIAFRGHALVWAVQNYGFQTFWGTDTSALSCSQLAANIKAHIFRDLAYYKGRLKEYDVWNEATHEQAFFTKCKDDPKYAPAGWALQDSAFVWARAADPTAKLYINDYNNVDGGDNESYYEEIKAMLGRGTPVDGIGIQCHFGGQTIDPANVKVKLDRLASLGLPIKVTEFDNEKMSGTAAFTPAQQAAQFNRFVRLMYSHPAVEGIVFWGFWDAHQWLSLMNSNVSAGIYTADKVAKPAVDSLKYLWNTLWTTDTSVTSNSQGSSSLRGFPGKYEAVVSVGNRIWTLPLDLTSSTSATLTLKGPSTTGIRKTGGRHSFSLHPLHGGLEVRRIASEQDTQFRIESLGGRRMAVATLAAGSTASRVALQPGAYVVVPEAGSGESPRRVAVVH